MRGHNTWTGYRVLERLRSQLDTARVDSSREREGAQRRKLELEAQLRRLTAAVAEGGHSAFLLNAIAERECALAEMESAATENCFGNDLEELRQFAQQRLSALPDLLSRDVPRARAELARHVTQITLTPAESNGQRHFTCHGDWNLLGAQSCQGDVRMVAGGGFEPPTFGL